MYLYVQCVLHKTYVTLYTVCVWHSNAIGLQENGDSSLELQLGFLRTPSVQRLRTLWAQKPVWGSNCVFLFSKVLIWKCQMLSTFKTGVTILDFFLNRFSTSCRFLNPNYHRQNFKVSSVQEACAKCFAVHILKVEILQITWKKWNKEPPNLSFQFFTNRFSILTFLALFFMWFVKFQILVSEPQSIWCQLLVYQIPLYISIIEEVFFFLFIHSLREKNPNATAEEIEHILDGNMCRCTGYRSIHDAFKSFATDASDSIRVHSYIT